MQIADIFKTDALGIILTSLVNEFKPSTILEIGSSDGSGSSTIFAEAIKGTDSELYCIEVMDDRFKELSRRMSMYDNVKCYKVSSVPLSGVVSKEYVEQFRNDHTDLNISKLYRTKLVMSWHDEVTAQIPMMEIMDGIEHIKIETGVAQFDMVFIDGSPFTGSAELKRVYGANVIIMDDTMDIKCYDPMMRLIADPAYELLIRNDNYRNGFAIFKKIDYANS